MIGNTLQAATVIAIVIMGSYALTMRTVKATNVTISPDCESATVFWGMGGMMIELTAPSALILFL